MLSAYYYNCENLYMSVCVCSLNTTLLAPERNVDKSLVLIFFFYISVFNNKYTTHNTTKKDKSLSPCYFSIRSDTERCDFLTNGAWSHKNTFC